MKENTVSDLREVINEEKETHLKMYNVRACCNRRIHRVPLPATADYVIAEQSSPWTNCKDVLKWKKKKSVWRHWKLLRRPGFAGAQREEKLTEVSPIFHITFLFGIFSDSYTVCVMAEKPSRKQLLRQKGWAEFSPSHKDRETKIGVQSQQDSQELKGQDAGRREAEGWTQQSEQHLPLRHLLIHMKHLRKGR